VAALKSRRRRKLPKSAFAIPSRRQYPIDTPARARAALAYSARPSTSGAYSTVRKAIAKRYGKSHPILTASRKRKGATTTASARRGRSRPVSTLASRRRARRRPG
jgi:hypothetical protein